MNNIKDDDYLWSEYYEYFKYFSFDKVREGCHPRKMIHKMENNKCIVLVHGLTDSPYFMKGLADFFHFTLNYNVFMPLLQGHGLKEPNGMVGVSSDEWKKNVTFGVKFASRYGDKISIGGLSTGGTLSLLESINNPLVSGDVYLFSAALGLYGKWFTLNGKVLEIILRRRITGILHSQKPLIGKNPYKYNYVPIIGARELSFLMKELNLIKDHKKIISNFNQRIFSAWSECDNVVRLKELKDANAFCSEDDYTSFIVPEDKGVNHANIVLDTPIYEEYNVSELNLIEEANPVFQKMLEAIRKFESN